MKVNHRLFGVDLKSQNDLKDDSQKQNIPGNCSSQQKERKKEEADLDTLCALFTKRMSNFF